MANFNTAVYHELISMGVLVPLAKEAASKFNTVDRAANWAFDQSPDWAPTGPSSTNASPSHSPPRDHSIGPRNDSTHTNVTVNKDELQKAFDSAQFGSASWNAGERTGGTAGPIGPGGKLVKRVEDMSYEEQLEAALRNSTEDSGGPGPGYGGSSGYQSQSGFGSSSGTTSGYGSMANSMTLPARPATITDKASLPSSISSGLPAKQPPAYQPSTGPPQMGSNNPFLNVSSPSQSTFSAPPLPTRKPPKLAKDLPPHLDNNAQGFGGAKMGESVAQGPAKGVSFGKVSDDAMNEEGRMVLRVADDEEDEEDRTRRGRSPTPAAAKRARVSDPSPDPIALDSKSWPPPSTAPPTTDTDADLDAVLRSSMETHLAEEQRRKARSGDYVSLIDAEAGPSAPAEMDMDVDMLADEELKTISVEDEIDDDLIPDREDGQPVVLATKDDNVIYASHMLQILSVVPQFRLAIESVILEGLNTQDPNVRRISYIQELFKAMAVGTKAFREVSKQVMSRFPVMGVMMGGMPDQARELLEAIVESWCAVTRMLPHDLTAGLALEAEAYRVVSHPRSLFESTARSGIRPEADPERKSSLSLDRDASHRRLTECINRFIWGQDQSMGIDSLADVFCLSLKNNHGTELLHLDEELFMDPYLASNRQAVQLYREVENNVKTELACLEIELDKLMWASVPLKAGGTKRVQIDDMLASAIAHFEGANALRGSADDVTKPDLMVEQLKRDRQKLQAEISVKKERHALLQGQLPDVFKKPELMHHRYLLRGVMLNAGFAGSTAFAAYWRDEAGQWWRGQGYQAVKSDINTLNADTTGLWFDGGPYFLVYSRDGPRPADMPCPEELDPVHPSDTSDKAMGSPEENEVIIAPSTNAPPDLLGGDSLDVAMLQDPMSATTANISHIENAGPGIESETAQRNY